MTHRFRIILIVTALFCTQGLNLAMAGQDGFAVWMAGVRQEAVEAGISSETSQAVMNHVALLPNVIDLDRAQPEFISPFLDYYHKRVNANTINKGRALLAQYEVLLDQIEVQYGVPQSVLIAFWGLETNYGTYQGKVDTLSALATLAYEGRRAGFFSRQLLDAMRIVDAGHANISQFKGSWAGAFGHMQFMPSTFINYAVDSDGDNAIDLVNSLPDTFSSAANYLSAVGWRIGEPAMVEVQLPLDFAWESAQLAIKKSTQEWAQLGVKALRKDNSISTLKKSTVKMPAGMEKTQQLSERSDLAQVQQAALSLEKNDLANDDDDAVTTTLPSVDGTASILLPQGWRGPAFMVFNNFHVIMDWNRSVNYALSVAQLAHLLNQESAIVGGLFAEEGALTFKQMFELQNALNVRGFNAGTPDGFPGLNTQAAVRAYQQSQQLAADGYASPSIYNRLMSQEQEQE